MSQTVRVPAYPGQRIIIDPVGSALISRTVTAKDKTLQSTYINGTYIDTPPPPPIVPPPAYTPSGPVVIVSSIAHVQGLDITTPAFSGQRGDGAIGPRGIYAKGVDHLVIEDCRIHGGDVGILLEHVASFTIRNCIIEDTDYAGVLTYSAVDGIVTQNQVRRIANARPDVMVGVDSNNAYGMAFSRYANGGLTVNPRSARIQCTLNTIEDVPLWHGLDTHQGQDITFAENTIRRVARGIFVTAGSDGVGGSINTVVRSNQILEAKTIPDPFRDDVDQHGTNAVGLFTAGAVGVTYDNNTVSQTYLTIEQDYQGGSTGIVHQRPTILVP